MPLWCAGGQPGYRGAEVLWQQCEALQLPYITLVRWHALCEVV